MKKTASIGLALSISFLAYAGGNPEYVKFPEGYQTKFTQYNTRNRTNGKQVAVLYANATALDSIASGKLAEGSKIVMEVYKIVSDADGNPIVSADGLFDKGKFAAVAVMEKRSDWASNFDASDRSADWGFAIYNTDGTAKKNDLSCASCHNPMPENDYLFSFSTLLKSSSVK